jgi:hypothetical protein
MTDKERCGVDMSGDDKELKSAFDIAMERAQKLGDMSVLEKQRSREEEFRAIGEALGKRYLDGLPIRDVEIELRRYEENRQIVIRYLLSFLLDALALGNSEGAENILAAVQHYSGDSGAVERIRNLFNEYQKAIEQAWEEKRIKLGAAQRKELKLRGISGSAVEPATEASPEWLEIRQRLDASYQKRFEEAKIPLLKAL